MAGDRGLALVVVGAIAIGVFWRIGADPARQLPPAGVNESSVMLGDLRNQGGGRALRDLTNRVTGDYRLFRQRLERLAGMRDARVESALEAEFSFPAPAEWTALFPQSLDNSIR